MAMAPSTGIRMVTRMSMESMAMTIPTDGSAGTVPVSLDADPASLYRLMTWLSPQFPVGSYTYSHGIEQAVEAGYIVNATTALAWIEDIVAHGAGRSDAVVLHQAHVAAGQEKWDLLASVAELAAAFQPASELALESHAQGRAFLDTVHKAWECPALAALHKIWPGPYAYPVVVGVAAAGHGIPAVPATQAYLHGLAGNLVSACIRLVPLGQSDGQRLIAALEPLVGQVAGQAGCASLEDLGSAVAMSDICAMRHETQYTRLFRS
jgi:urease accessory protein